MDFVFEASFLDDLWGKALTRPWRELTSRSRKEIRSQLVTVGFLLVGGSVDQLESTSRVFLRSLQDAIETLYLGSLIIDDIEDDGVKKRSSPCLHRQYGLPVALNLGNYLYFEALEKIREANFSPAVKIQLYEAYHHTLLEGHRGQALDLSTKIDELDPQNVEEVCMKSLQLKSGSLAGLALKMGALAHDEQVPLTELEEIGARFGMALQMLDDIKHFEDLNLQRPSWIWASLVRFYSVEDFVLFKMAVAELPEASSLTDFLERTDLKKKALDEMQNYHQKTMELLRTRFDLHEGHAAYVRVLDINAKFGLSL
jgi:geranylgeranyl pyrophosphate synthase